MNEGKRALRKFGKRVRQLRKDKQWSQEDLAFELEVGRSYVSDLERGVRNPTLVTLVCRLGFSWRVIESQGPGCFWVCVACMIFD